MEENIKQNIKQDILQNEKVTAIQPAIEPIIQPTQNPTPANKKATTLTALIILILILVLAGFGYFYVQNQQLKSQLAKSTISDSSPETPIEQDLTANWKNYSHKINQISFTYPADWIIDVTNENESYNATVTLTNKNYIIRIISRADGLGGTISTAPTKPVVIDGQTYYKQYYTFTHDKVIRIDNQPDGIGAISTNGISYIIDLTYPDSEVNSTQESQVLSEFDQILSAFKFLDKTSVKPTSKPATTLSYVLPSAWQTVQDNTHTFEVGFDPATQEGDPNTNLAFPNAVAVTYKNLSNYPYYSPFASSSYFFIKDYNGGPRHAFIETEIIKEKLSQHNYQEKDYFIQGKNCLVLYNLDDMSQGHTTIGMCPLSANQALVFTTFADADKLEPILKTIKFLK